MPNAPDLSPLGMFANADAIVQGILIGLVLASVVTWTIWLAKTVEFASARRELRRARAELMAARSLAEARHALAGRTSPPVQEMLRQAEIEIELSSSIPEAEGIRDRIALGLNRVEAAQGRRMALGTGILATIGATAPFVGLLGTVWGIMNSFIGIAKAHTTNLAVVAPGIAEALLATAIGLAAAIPAVVVYNIFARALAGYKGLLGDVSAQVLRHASRDLDLARAGQHGRTLARGLSAAE